MKYLPGIFVIASVFILSCHNEKKADTESSNIRINLLLPTSVPVSQLFMFDTSGIPGWQQELKAAHVVEKIFGKVMNSEITVFNSNTDDSVKCTKEEILNNMGVQAEPLNLNEIKSLFFEEEWFLDTTEPFLFEKKVLCWYPVRYYQRDGQELKKLIFKVAKGKPAELLAKNVIYEFNLEDTINPSFIKNLDNNKITRLLIDFAVSGKTKLWNPMNIDHELSAEEIRKNLGQAIDTTYIEDPETGKSEQKIQKQEINPSEIQSIVFVEDWYYDPSTFAIKKVIKGIGPVRHYLKTDGEMAKTVVFMMYLGNEKTKIFE